MRIEQLEPDINLYRGYCDDLARLIESQRRTDRPCPDCTLPCLAHKSPTCACKCAPDCEHAAKQMSSEGDQFPIEEKIAPLVYSFHHLRECRPCWSCEGHAAHAGGPMRLPRVIFYARSSVYPALIAEAVATLLFQRKLTSRWEVVVTPLGSKLDATFTLQPCLAPDENIGLDRLQTDARVIADNLQKGVMDAAQIYQKELSATLNTAEPV